MSPEGPTPVYAHKNAFLNSRRPLKRSKFPSPFQTKVHHLGTTRSHAEGSRWLFYENWAQIFLNGFCKSICTSIRIYITLEHIVCNGVPWSTCNYILSLQLGLVTALTQWLSKPLLEHQEWGKFSISHALGVHGNKSLLAEKLKIGCSSMFSGMCYPERAFGYLSAARREVLPGCDEDLTASWQCGAVYIIYNRNIYAGRDQIIPKAKT